MTVLTDRRLSLRTQLADRLRAAATYDVFPEFSAKIRRLLYNPLGILILAACAALVCGFFLQAQGFVLFGSVVAVIVLGVLWPWLSLRGLRGSISFEKARAVEGERVEACLTLHSRLPWAAYGLALRAGLQDQNAQAEADLPSISIASAPRRRTARCRWSFLPARRGVYPLATPLLTTGFPFGLWENKRALSVEAPLVVWPRTYPVGPVPMVGGDRQVEGNVSRNKVGSNGDVLGVRPYRRGDSPRRIHWGQSARHDRLIVCELQANARPVVQLVLDADPAVHVGHGPDSSREWAIRIVGSLAKGWLAAGVEVGAVCNGEEIPAASGPKQLNALLDALARLPDTPLPLSPSEGERGRGEGAGTPLSETMSSPACRGFTDGLQVIVTTDVSAAGADSRSVGEHQRWVVLQTQGFLSTEQARSASEGKLPPSLALRACVKTIRPWLLIETPEHVPPLLRGGWKEALHGS
jgi:uncharacterized protein (DUF58 family)